MGRRKQSQRETLVEILSDGRWHTNAEINELRRMTVNSRVSELRSKGYAVEHSRNPHAEGAAAYRYRLLSRPGVPPATDDRSPGLESSADVGEKAASGSAARAGEPERPPALFVAPCGGSSTVTPAPSLGAAGDPEVEHRAPRAEAAGSTPAPRFAALEATGFVDASDLTESELDELEWEASRGALFEVA